MIDTFIVGIGGKMGQNILSAAKDYEDIRICGGLDMQSGELGGAHVFTCAEEVDLKNIDVIVDFSRPSTLPHIVKLCERFNCACVLASTGYSESELATISKLSEKHAVLKSGNMSLGVNLITSLVEQAAKALGGSFDIEIVEKHHNKKVDAPSGTALMLAQAAAKAKSGKSEFVCGRSGNDCKRKPSEIGISSVRGGTIVGEHDVMFVGDDEIVTVSHTALSRKIFAHGALKAVRFMAGKKKGLYDMKNVLFE